MSGMELFFGSAAVPGVSITGAAGPIVLQAAAPATAGLLGAGGAFGAAQALTTGLGTVSALGSLSSGAAESRALKANAQRAQAEAAFNASQERRRTQAILSAQRAGFGASGAVVNEGTPVEVLASTAAEGEFDALSILYGGAIESAIAKQEARAARTGSYFGAGTSLMQTGLSLAQR